jgi:HK97 family phage prohead protease
MERKLYQIHSKSLEECGASTLKELWDKKKGEGFTGMKTAATLSLKKAEDEGEENVFHAVFSTDKKDRHGEIVHQSFDLKAYKKNPVILDSHNYSSIEAIIGKAKRLKSGDVLEGDIEFALDNPRGMLAAKLAVGGYLNTCSIGFIPQEFSEDFMEILKSELLEVSMVSVPANPEALIEKMQKSIEEAEPAEIMKAAEETIEEKEENIEEKEEIEPEVIGKEEIPAEKIVEEIKKIEIEKGEIRKNVLKNIARELAKINQLNADRKKKNIFRMIRNLLRE